MLQDTGNLIHQHCPQFTKIGFFGWFGLPFLREKYLINVFPYRKDEGADRYCATLLNDIRPQTLRSFGVFGSSKIGAESFLALNRHCSTLVKLELHSIQADAMQHLSRFKDCVNIKFLVLAENSVATQDLKSTHKDVFSEMVEWLQNCKTLRSISISNFQSATALLTPFLRDQGIELTNLVLETLSLSNNDNSFFQALALQSSLRSLHLKGEESDIISENDMFVESLSQLVNLTDLRLVQISANFMEKHIRALARNLTKLETFWTGGFCITDRIWPDIAKLQYLTRLDLNADTRFTSSGILDFVHSLGPNNHGLTLSVMMQDTDCDIPEQEQEMIRKTLSSELGGRFDFLLVRGPEEEGNFSSDDSD